MTALTQLNFRKELAMFKTPKRFFEMNGRKQMEAALKDKIQKQCEIYLQVESEKHLSYYQVAMHEELAHLKKESENTLKQAYQAITIILQKPLDLESMKVCYAKISEHRLSHLRRRFREFFLRKHRSADKTIRRFLPHSSQCKKSGNRA